MSYHILSKCGSSLHYGRACAFSESQPHQMTCCIGHNCMLFLCCEWLCASSDLLLDWMTYGILNTCASCLHSWQAYVSPFWICFAQIRNIQHRGDWQTRSSGLDWIGFTSGYRVSTALRIAYWPFPNDRSNYWYQFNAYLDYRRF